MHHHPMNFLTLTFLLINTQSDTSVPDSRTSSLIHPEVIYDTNRNRVNRRTLDASSLTGGPESSTIVYQNVRGIGVKIKNVNGDFTTGGRQAHRGKGSKSTSLSSQPAGRLRRSDASSSSSFSSSPSQPVYLPMETLPGLDLEIDAMGLGGVPPGVRIETRNGRPVVEILPNLELMHSMANEENTKSKSEESLTQEKKRSLHRSKAKRDKESKSQKYLKARAKHLDEETDDDASDDDADDVPDPDDDMANLDVMTKRPESKKTSRNISELLRLQPELFEPLKNVTSRTHAKHKSSRIFVVSDMDSPLTRSQEHRIDGNSRDSGDYPIKPFVPRDMSDPRTTPPGRRTNQLPWNYEEEDKWIKRFPSCIGESQSPINLTPKMIEEESGLSLEFTSLYNYKLPKARLMNTGLTLELVIDRSASRPGITGSAVYDDMYLFEKFHFHWGSKNTIGSEHSIYGQKYPVEMHFVHFNDKYKDLEEAADKADGLCVIAVFFQVSHHPDNPRFNQLLNHLQSVECGGQVTSVNDHVTLTNFLPSNRRDFYRYQGSLTTPPCSESVTWIILKHGLLISKSQLKQLRELKQHNCQKPISNNWRNLQPANGRRIEKSVAL